jgi:hypothetical protein
VLHGTLEKLQYAARLVGRWAERSVPMTIVAPRPLRATLRCSLPTCACRINNFIWVSEKLRLVYFETPKCGCTSIKRALDIDLEQSVFASAYLMQMTRSAGEHPNVLSLRHDLGAVEMSFHRFDLETRRAAKRMCERPFMSAAIGRHGFRHFFGSPEDAVASFPEYRSFVVHRDPFDRLYSAWSMFYTSSPARLRQRVSQTAMAVEEQQDISRLIEDIDVAPNHHFEPLTRFVPLDLLTSGQIEVVPLSQLDQYWRRLNLTGRNVSLPFLNQGKKTMKSEGLIDELRGPHSLSRIYHEDLHILK